MLLNRDEILQLLTQNVVQGAELQHVNCTSLDITLGQFVLVEQAPARDYYTVDYSKRQSPVMQKVDISRGFQLMPGEFVLAQSKEIFNLPLDISAEYKLKSSMARIGLQHLNAGWCDPGWHGSVLTMELVNVTRYTNILLHPGDRIGQMVFFRHTPVQAHESYAQRGRYNNDSAVHTIKL